MNERIRLLAEQAGFSFKYKTAPDELNPGHKLQDLEKFAELIVRECVNIVKPTQHHEAFAQGYMGGVDGLDLLYSKVKQIKQHLGVEK